MFEQILTYVLLGASLAVDAFAVTVAQGLACPENRMSTTVKQATYFGAFQFLMPLLGFYLAGTVSEKIATYGPYISFVMLAFVGGKMLIEAIREKPGEENENPKANGFSHGKTIVLAIATSIDALAVGVSFAFTESSVWLPCARMCWPSATAAM